VVGAVEEGGGVEHWRVGRDVEEGEWRRHGRRLWAGRAGRWCWWIGVRTEEHGGGGPHGFVMKFRNCNTLENGFILLFTVFKPSLGFHQYFPPQEFDVNSCKYEVKPKVHKMKNVFKKFSSFGRKRSGHSQSRDYKYTLGKIAHHCT
jgi:hypothetical protein